MLEVRFCKVKVVWYCIFGEDEFIRLMSDWISLGLEEVSFCLLLELIVILFSVVV